MNMYTIYYNYYTILFKHFIYSAVCHLESSITKRRVSSYVV